MIAFLLNVALALIWFFLGDQPSGARLLIGFVVGFGIIHLFRSALPEQTYTRRTFAFLVFLMVFLRELILSNLQLAWIVLTRDPRTLRPSIFTYPVAELHPLEILVLSHCLTLTPGTATIDIEDDFKTLRIHVIHAENVETVKANIHRNIEARLRAFTR
jgi:multicomponent Na+:H+ antiporter subunit E